MTQFTSPFKDTDNLRFYADSTARVHGQIKASCFKELHQTNLCTFQTKFKYATPLQRIIYSKTALSGANVAQTKEEIPQIPSDRNYHVRGFLKQRLPQRRMLIENFLGLTPIIITFIRIIIKPNLASQKSLSDATTGICVSKGEIIKVTGFSENTSMLTTEIGDTIINIPEKCTRITTAP